MFPVSIPEIVTRVLILLVVFPAHELAHALSATALGDPTPRQNGRLTLNPIRHLDLWGSLLFLVAGVGWASTPINPANFGDKWRLKLGMVSLVGPLTNLALALAGSALFRLFGSLALPESAADYLPSPAYFFALFTFLNLLLGFFNLIPVAPLDGAQVLGALIPDGIAREYESVQRYGFYILIVLLFVLPRFGIDILGFLVNTVVLPLGQPLIPGLSRLFA
jgi:Zn-dependent protease